MSTAFGFTYVAPGPVLQMISAEFGLSDAAAGLVAATLFLGIVVTVLVGSYLPDRFPADRVVAWGLSITLLGNLATGLAPTIETLLLARAAGGVGAGLGFVAIVRYVARRYGALRSHFGQGVQGSGYPLGGALALWGMPFLAVQSGWRGGFLQTSIVIALVLVAWRWSTPVTPMVRPGTTLDALRCANCWGTFVQHAAGFGLVVAAGTWITTYIVRTFALPLELSGVLGSLLLVSAIVARPLGGFLAVGRHLTTLMVMRSAQLLILAGLVLLAFPERPLVIALLGATAVGFGGSVSYAAVFNTAAASLPGAPGAAQGFTALGGFVSILVGAPAMGLAIQTLGFAAAWIILATVSVTALLVSFLMLGEEDLSREPLR